jgi:hypothetical protein
VATAAALVVSIVSEQPRRSAEIRGSADSIVNVKIRFHRRYPIEEVLPELWSQGFYIVFYGEKFDSLGWFDMTFLEFRVTMTKLSRACRTNE